ncbi:MAG: CBS and ACT domain-containing protein [Deferrisomatales bacterium]
MRVRHIMTSPVITVSSETPVLDAAKLMKEKRIERLPVVDDGRLVGIVTKDRVLRSSPSMATSLSLHEIHYLFAKLTVKEIMQRDVVTVSPDSTVENAVRIAQDKRVGCLPVVEDGRVIGILTTNDFFYLVLNPLLGIGEEGSRVIVRHCATPQQIIEALQCVADTGHTVVNAAYLPSRRGGEKDFLIHIESDEIGSLVECMKERGIEVEERER